MKSTPTLHLSPLGWLPPQRPFSAAGSIYVWDTSSHQLGECLATFAGWRGWRPEVFTEEHDLRARLALASPLVLCIIADPADEEARRLATEAGISTSLLWVGPHDSFAARRQAVDAGAIYYISQPLDAWQLAVALDALTAHTASSWRLLVVTGSLESAANHPPPAGDFIEQHVHVLDEGEALLARIAALEPDALLIANDVPEPQARLLAKVVQSHPAMAALPIVRDLGQLEPAGAGRPRQSALVLARDLTRFRARMSQWAGENERLLHALHEHAIVSITDAHGRITYANDRFCKISGYAQEELLGRTHRVVNSGTHPREFFREMWQCISQGHTWHGELCNRRKDGSPYWVASTIVPSLDAKGRPAHYISIRTDITRQKETEQILRVHRQEFQLIFDSVPAMIWFKDCHNNVLRANRAAALTAGISPEEMEGRASSELYPEHADDYYRDDVAVITSRKAKLGIVEKLRTAQGEERWLRTDKVPVMSDAGHVRGVIVFAVDITDQMRAQQALAQSEERLTRSQTFAEIGTWDWNIATGELYWSERIPALFGHKMGALQTTYANFLAAVHPDDRQRVVEAVDACVHHGAKYEIEHRVVWPDASVHWVLERGNVVRSEDGTPLRMLGVVQDITQRKELEYKFARQTGLIHALRRAMSAFVVKPSLADVAQDMLGTLLQITESRMGFMMRLTQDAGGQLCAAIQAARNVQFRRDAAGAPDQHTFPIPPSVAETFTHGRPIVGCGHKAADALCEWLAWASPVQHLMALPVFHGDTLVGAYAVANRAGGYEPDLADSLRPFTATFGVLLHAHEMREKERDAQRQLLDAKDAAEKASRAKSEFLSSMSHELRTPLNVMLGFTQLLDLDPAGRLSAQQHRNLEEIMRAGQHLLKLIEEVLDLARIETGRLRVEMGVVDLRSVVDDCMRLVEPLAKARNIKLFCEASAWERCWVRADANRLRQVLLNLLSNAIKYNREGGDVRLSAQVLDADVRTVRVCVTDTGPGISPHKQHQLFVPFNRLGLEGSGIEGTGIGLVIARRVLALMDGTLGVTSAEGEGSTFWFTLVSALPASPGSADKETRSHDAPRPPLVRRATVLYVEDNAANVRLLEQILAQRPQVTLLHAPTGELALEIASAYVPDLIVMDLNLPGMSGWEAARRLRTQESTRAIPLVALSADLTALSSDQVRASGFDYYLGKPIDVHEFLSMFDSSLALAADPLGSDI